MNAIYSTKDRDNLIIEEELLNTNLSALAFMYNDVNGTVEVKIVHEGKEEVLFTIDSLKAMRAISYFMLEKFHEAEQLTASGNSRTNVKLNDDAVQSLWIKLNQDGRSTKS